MVEVFFRVGGISESASSRGAWQRFSQKSLKPGGGEGGGEGGREGGGEGGREGGVVEILDQGRRDLA